MRDRERTLRCVTSSGVVAVIRIEDPAQLIKVAEALKAGGIESIEFTMTTPRAIEMIAQAVDRLGDEVLIGTGTVLDAETARAAILAGAAFVVAPNLDLRVIELCRRYGVVVVPGCLTPTEILTAWTAGADLVKVFPASVMGPAYLKAILAPLPQVRLLPTGGIDLENVGDFVAAGAAAVGVGGSLVDGKAVREGRFDVITQRAEAFVAAVAEARAGKG